MPGFVCNRFPFLTITRRDGEPIQFENGLFVSEDPDVIEQIQAHPWWTVHIHPRDLVEPVAAEPPRVRHGGRGTR